MKITLTEYQEKMQKSIASLEFELGTVRAGKANASVLDKIRVDYYGTPSPINQLATISTPDPRTLVIQPYDGSLLKLIEKEINASDIGIVPQSDGRVIRMIFPMPTEERRKELAKVVSKTGEDTKVALRNIRRDANDEVKAMKKNGEMTEDEQKASEKDIQDLTDKFIKQVDAICDKKTKEIMSI